MLGNSRTIPSDHDSHSSKPVSITRHFVGFQSGARLLLADEVTLLESEHDGSLSTYARSSRSS